MASEDDYKQPGREEVDAAFVIIYVRWKTKGQWDKPAWGTLWEYCRSIVSGRVQCPGDVNEILSAISRKLQEVFEKRALVKDPTAFVNKTISNAVIDGYRQKKRRSGLVERILADLVTQVQGEAYMPAEQMSTAVAEIFRDLADLVDEGRISATDKQIFLLQYLHGYSVREISRMLGNSKTSVGSASQFVLKQLQESVLRKGAIL